ncbi:YjgN family protein [Dongia rigui]|uniref:YjgN family protein n=1 Tax=Dongia rigui TaxID=940149 RepID=A0ABU5E042_9PROT|nr:YjgN family protein [Dongia rigui]MDY0872954.1 YjgN family protein [Dongia rigui]
MSDIAAGAGQPAPETGFGRRPAEQQRTHFVYDGRLGELYWIFIKNILLTILTLSIWRFWGKTRIRRYLWSHTSLAGDRFEYTGTGGELFVGFIIVMVAFVIANIGITALHIVLEPGSMFHFAAQWIFGVFIVYLTFVAQYAAQRYRLTRTLWRGISGGMTGSAWAWGFKAMWFSILSLLSLTLAWPWAQMRLLDDRLNNSYFGDAKASIQSSSRALYVPYLLGAVVSYAVMGLIGYLGYRFLMDHYGDALQEIFTPIENPQDRVHTGEYAAAMGALYAIVLGGYLAVIVIAIIAYAAYYVALLREVANKLTLGGLQFSTSITIGRFIGRYLVNLLIIVLTLGLGLPIAIHRTMLFICRNVEIIGEIDGSEITRAELPRPKFGEGLLEAFDPGIL